MSVRWFLKMVVELEMDSKAFLLVIKIGKSKSNYENILWRSSRKARYSSWGILRSFFWNLVIPGKNKHLRILQVKHLAFLEDLRNRKPNCYKRIKNEGSSNVKDFFKSNLTITITTLLISWYTKNGRFAFQIPNTNCT